MNQKLQLIHSALYAKLDNKVHHCGEGVYDMFDKHITRQFKGGCLNAFKPFMDELNGFESEMNIVNRVKLKHMDDEIN